MMTIASSAFQHNDFIPSIYTCDGQNYNPPLIFSDVPAEAKSLVLIVDDPDAPMKVFTHWVVYNMPPSTMQILENEMPAESSFGKNDFGNTSYGGPCPPSGVHRYFFKLFALDKKLDLPEGASRDEVEDAMKNHILTKAELIGLYKKGGE